VRKITIEEFQKLATIARNTLADTLKHRPIKIFGVPAGGVPAAAAIADGRVAVMVGNPVEAEVLVDDLIDSGATLQKYLEVFPEKPFVALIDKRSWAHGDEWVVWPWEVTAEKGIEDHVRRLIQFAGDDPTREGLHETPKRVAEAWRFWCSGYERDPTELLKTFQDGAEGCDEMVVVKDIPFYTHCEHHLTPFFGTATIAYLPDGKVVGLSKLSRVLDVFARRLQVQERLTAQVADAIVDGLAPKGVGVVVKARHLCMESRGVCQQGHHTVTSALRGAIRDEASARAEFLALAR
jgi:GTP cyclohydrolase I